MSSGDINTSATNGTGGAIALGTGNISNLNLPPSGVVNGDTINISEFGQGNITTGNFNSSGQFGGGAIDILTFGKILLGELNSSSTLGTAGRILLYNAQPIFLPDAPGIQLNFINAQGLTLGGGIDITTDGYFWAKGTFPNNLFGPVSIATMGDPIIIRHGGGRPLDPFEIGEIEIGNDVLNGTAGAITNGRGFQGTITAPNGFTGPVQLDNILIIPRQPSQSNLPFSSINVFPPFSSNVADADIEISSLESIMSDEFSGYLGPQRSINNPADAPKILEQIQQQTGIKSAFIYATFVGDRLQVRLVSSQTKNLATIGDATKDVVVDTVNKLRREITNPIKRGTTSYLAPAQQLYQWLIAPLEADLQAQGIQNLVLITDAGLRSLPIAALHDGQNFLVEKYSIGLMPSLSLTDTTYVDIKTAPVLAMGISTANDLAKSLNLSPLPAVPIELQTIVGLRGGQSFLNDKFTQANLQSQRQGAPIVHLATHAEFKPGPLENSYILLWDKPLRLNQVRELGWNQKPAVELLVLSACKTAAGDGQAELGFAGFAIQAGVKSALASLWYVSDEGTSGLMSEFYRQLQTAPIKAEALRQAQLAMIHGQVRVEAGQLRSTGASIPLPAELQHLQDQTLSHPYYWAAFTMIGSPW